MKYWTILILLIFSHCGQKKANSTSDRIEYIRALIKKVGIKELPYNYDMVKRNIHSKYSVDRNSMDTLFFDDLNGSIEGVLPDTSNYFGFIYYKIGDSIYPWLVTIDGQGKIIDRQQIGIGACGGLAIDVDSCVDRVSINKDLQIDMLYKMRGSADTNDSIPRAVKICNRIFGKGKITKEGKIEIILGKLEVCE